MYTASDGKEGTKKVLAEKPDVMVVDEMMPLKDGYQGVSEVRSKLGVNYGQRELTVSSCSDDSLILIALAFCSA